MEASLHTLLAPTQHQQDIKKSRFLAQAMPVGSSEQALSFVRAASMPDATHNCWAYRLGQQYRFNDDGEPGGTAGRPILQAIDGQGMDRVAVLVTRWYGGINLGPGGLIRAYGGTAAECLRCAERLTLIPMSLLAVECDFSDLPLLKSRLKEFDAHLDHETFGASNVELLLQLPTRRLSEAEARIVDMSKGRSKTRRLPQANDE